MTRKRVVLAAAIIAIVGLAAAGTNAYTTAEAHTTNVITTGEISITLNDAIKGGEQVSGGWELGHVMPGMDVKKPISVTNDGPGDAWVRVLVYEFSDPSHADLCDMVSFKLDDDDWVDGQDGWYYYSKPLKAGEDTSHLFVGDKVSFSPEMGNDYQGCKVTMLVLAQATQVKNNHDDLDQLGSAQDCWQLEGTWPEFDESSLPVPSDPVPLDPVPLDEP